ncbi:MAG: hypothetical protein DRR08_18380 [Candidatus Parabeggiatoa sp. nov. 2]|nr:MAG: hypothetical protein B6247_17785 [Beggiatoa sp. 4572_84]RKZ57676.1 MAG: hypothetical protein DRR08_18380 [Gammaproteobacteria bacterium]
MTARANIDELQATLGKYLKMVQAGETIIITEKEREIAMLSPITTERQVLMTLAQEGKARLGSGKRWQGASIEVDMSHASVTQAIIEARENGGKNL